MAPANPRTAILFPGQGSQTSAMAAVTAAHRPDLLELARAELGDDPFARVESTRFAQPAMYCASLAYWTRAGSPRGEMVAGHSLGELAALVAAGALGAEQGLRLAIVRGRLMDEAGQRNPGAMLAVLGGEQAVVGEVAAAHGVVVANENAPGQLVLAGAVEAIAAARKELRAAGAKAIRLPVSGAFHSPLMESAVDGFRRALADVEVRAPERTVYSATAAAPFADVRAGLLAALTRPVLWTQTLGAMAAAGVTRFLETGPGDVLTGLVRRTVPEAEARSLAELEAVHG